MGKKNNQEVIKKIAIILIIFAVLFSIMSIIINMGIDFNKSSLDNQEGNIQKGGSVGLYIEKNPENNLKNES